MPNFVPLHCHTHYSLLDGLSKPSHIVDACKKLGYNACAITDHGNIGGTVDFFKTLKKAKIKPILGCELYLCNDDPSIKEKTNPNTAHLVVMAKNKGGWTNLIKLMTECNREDYVYYNPRIQRGLIKPFASGLVSFSGHMGSELANCLFYDHKAAYSSSVDPSSWIDPDWKAKAIALALEYQDIFGKGNFFIEIQTINKTENIINQMIGDMLREVSLATGIPCVATADSHYATRNQADDHRVLLACNMGTTIPEIYKKMYAGEDVGLSGFFRSTNYHIPSLEEMLEVNTEEEIANTQLIADMCEDYEILRNPIIPSLEIPEKFKDDSEYLKQLCRDGWVRNGISNNDVRYAERIKMELDTIMKAGLSSYFLIVNDYVNFAKSKGYLVGAGRGSGAGCLISYLLGITSIDPIKYGLFFERFYNEGRNTKDRISLPDIDCDFPTSKRGEIIQYLKGKYGDKNVGHISTFGTMQGRGALKEVMRARGGIGHDLKNEITSIIPGKEEISDKLQEMEEEYGHSSIIQWALENRSVELSQWCTIDDDGNLEGDYANIFAQAIRLEGTKRNKGIHASGIVISSTGPLGDLCPLLVEDGTTACGFEMNALEDIGLPKFDILGVNLLDKMMTVQERLIEVYSNECE